MRTTQSILISLSEIHAAHIVSASVFGKFKNLVGIYIYLFVS